MKGSIKWGIFLIVTGLLVNTSLSEASIVLNEILADPPAGISGDANSDGIRSSTQDEFLELLNFGSNEIDISNWRLADSIATRHIFPTNTVLAPRTFLVLFGGGSPNLPGVNWQVASTGTLGLNNSSDTVILSNHKGIVIDQVVYGAIGGRNQSITRDPDGEGIEFLLHSNADGANGAIYSPGTSIDSRLTLESSEEDEPSNNPVIPELPTLAYFISGCGPLLLKRYIKC